MDSKHMSSDERDQSALGKRDTSESTVSLNRQQHSDLTATLNKLVFEARKLLKTPKHDRLHSVYTFLESVNEKSVESDIPEFLNDDRLLLVTNEPLSPALSAIESSDITQFQSILGKQLLHLKPKRRNKY